MVLVAEPEQPFPASQLYVTLCEPGPATLGSNRAAPRSNVAMTPVPVQEDVPAILVAGGVTVTD